MAENEIDLSGLQTFLSAFQTRETQLVEYKLNRDTGQYRHMFHGVQSIDRLGSELGKINAPAYNLFDILHIRHYEARVHTPFLANLLSPGGSHQQGSLLYDLFIEHLFPDRKEDFKAGPFLRVIEEQSVSDLGRLDIVIRNYDPDRPFAIIIENKIYASDQPDQLKRYYDVCTKHFGLEHNQFKLCYLTLHKTRPSSDSISNENLENWINEKLLRLTGYNSEIAPWLQEALSVVRAPKVRSTIEQYLFNLKTL